jgi:hypothetical protein
MDRAVALEALMPGTYLRSGSTLRSCGSVVRMVLGIWAGTERAGASWREVARLAELVAERDALCVLATYWRGIDRSNAELMCSAFWPEAHVD